MMPSLTWMNLLTVFVFSLIAGAGWHAGNWLASKILK